MAAVVGLMVLLSGRGGIAIGEYVNRSFDDESSVNVHGIQERGVDGSGNHHRTMDWLEQKQQRVQVRLQREAFTIVHVLGSD